MKILVVDDEKLALDSLKLKLKTISNNIEVFCFDSSEESLQFIKNNLIDVAFLDINLGDTNGIILAKKFKDILPSIQIIFTTGYSEYAIDAYKIHAKGYLLKPISIEDLKEELNNINVPLASSPSNSLLKIITFGNFQIYNQGEIFNFSRSKSKEIFAYLIDREGSCCSLKEIASILWEDGLYDRSRQKQMQTYIHDMIKDLKEIHQENVVFYTRNNLAIQKENVDCDYYKFLEKDIQAINSYHGEYMTNYSWAEFTLGFLENKK